VRAPNLKTESDSEHAKCCNENDENYIERLVLLSMRLTGARLQIQCLLSAPKIPKGCRLQKKVNAYVYI